MWSSALHSPALTGCHRQGPLVSTNNVEAVAHPVHGHQPYCQNVNVYSWGKSGNWIFRTYCGWDDMDRGPERDLVSQNEDSVRRVPGADGSLFRWAADEGSITAPEELKEANHTFLVKRTDATSQDCLSCEGGPCNGSLIKLRTRRCRMEARSLDATFWSGTHAKPQAGLSVDIAHHSALENRLCDGWYRETSPRNPRIQIVAVETHCASGNVANAAFAGRRRCRQALEGGFGEVRWRGSRSKFPMALGPGPRRCDAGLGAFLDRKPARFLPPGGVSHFPRR